MAAITSFKELPVSQLPEPETITMVPLDTALSTAVTVSSGSLITANSLNDRFLMASPYTKAAHLLDLETLDKPHQFMARALTTMLPTTDSFATTPYPDAFNWREVIARLEQLSEEEGYVYPETAFYVIAFRSRVRPATDRTRLGMLDSEAHKEAVRSGGLLKYWFGVPDTDGKNMATCVWRSRADAKSAGAGKEHARAMQAIRDFYLEWKVERMRFVVGDGARSYSIMEWSD